jgi:hypothetical protein
VTLVPRLLVAALAVVCAVVAFGAHRSDDRCDDTLAAARRVAAGTVAAQGPGLARAVLSRCHDSRDAVTVVLLLSGNGDRTDALTVAEGLVRREPDDYLGWFVLGGLERGQARRTALARARELNPTVGQRRTAP